MRNIFFATTVVCLLITSCVSKTESFSDQLKENFVTHLNKMDSSLVLDSFSVKRVDTINQRLFSFVNDTLYKLSLASVQRQLTNAARNGDTDSMAFYQSELDYMIPTRDSITKEISKSDTVKKYGLVAICQVQISKGNEKVSDKMFYFLDKKMTIKNGELIDSMLTAITRKMASPAP